MYNGYLYKPKTKYDYLDREDFRFIRSVDTFTLYKFSLLGGALDTVFPI